MSPTLEELVERPRTALGEVGIRIADAPKAIISDDGISPGAARRDSGNTLTRSSSYDQPSESLRWSALSDRFDGLRIPSSPLHEF